MIAAPATREVTLSYAPRGFCLIFLMSGLKSSCRDVLALLLFTSDTAPRSSLDTLSALCIAFVLWMIAAMSSSVNGEISSLMMYLNSIVIVLYCYLFVLMGVV